MSTAQKQVQTDEQKHTLSVVVSYNLNALSRIIGIFSSKGFEIDSISFGSGKESGLARITITTHGDEQIIEQITKQLHKIIDVVTVADLTYESFVERELALVKVKASNSARSEIMQITQVFRAKVIDISPGKLAIEITGNRDKIDAFIGMVRPFGIIELARTGSVALKREFNGSV
ncbi:acetolactate synthase small subunit [Fodinibius halophilus]|uniref:Acetolactate synthase small subunit n=1 Tax=Fodinibius halophilus TaxID=1736908 RepID=A0A6M1SZY4_9BACT|nr:acetolactate synthase small subunit [Fodinibius halophilus]NGP87209.1 acetolactate synthase small subunit [Fodinibius halophilus]